MESTATILVATDNDYISIAITAMVLSSDGYN
jgi:hypothetical protein